MRYYVPEPPYFRFFRQKQACQAVTVSAEVALDREAPKNKDDLRREKEAKQAAAQAAAAQPNAAAHRFLDQVQAAHKWLTVPPAGKAPASNPSPSPTAPKEKPLEPFDLQDVPEAEQATGYKLDPALMRLWFSKPAYAVQSKEQKECAAGAPFYPTTQVNATTLKLAELMKIERIQLAIDKIKSKEFLNSKPVQDALHKVCSRLKAGYGFSVDPEGEFGGDLQKMHRRYAFASVTVGKHFLQDLDDIRTQDVDKSKLCADEVALALGEFKLYAAIQDARVSYLGRTVRRVHIKEIAIYIMAPYGFDSFDQDAAYMGHFNKKHFALVTDGDWVKTPVYTGQGIFAKSEVLRPVFKPHFMRWRAKHNKGGDMLLFSERRPSFPFMEVDVPLHNAVSSHLAAQEVLNALQRGVHANDYQGHYQFQLKDFGEYATAGTKVIDRIDGTIRLNSRLFSEVSAENIELFAGAVAHETLHQNQNVLSHLRDSLPVVGQNTWHEELDDKALADSAAVLEEIKNALNL